MAEKEQVEIPIVDDKGNSQGSLRIEIPPKSAQQTSLHPLLDFRNNQERSISLEPVQLLEGTEYFYEVSLDLDSNQAIKTEPEEIFNPDDLNGKSGRLRTGLYAGCLPIKVIAGDEVIGSLALEVRSRKLDYLNHYRWMLGDIAEGLAEVIMERFAPTEQRFKIYQAHDARTLYQRFAFLKSLIAGDVFDGALQQILARPHRLWVEEEELRRPGQCIPSTSTIARQLAKPGRRMVCDELNAVLNTDSIPFQLNVNRKEETLDTPENQFVKFALSLWRSVVAEIGAILERQKRSIPVDRGLREIKEVKDKFDSILSRDLFRQVSRLSFLPTGSQVLQKREGYRDLFRIYIQFEAAALLTWSDGEDVYGAGQRDVATLYEYWVFFELARIVSAFCDLPFDWDKILEKDKEGLSIKLRRGKKMVFSGILSRLGRHIRVELWFNKTFSAKAYPEGSWTRPMRPDFSLLIRPDEKTTPGFESVWLHFDAKYRIETIENIFGTNASREEDEDTLLKDKEIFESQERTKRADLLKMHAYRDAIRRSAGSYVIYPGDECERMPQYHEILPGIGAFALKPSVTGQPTGAARLTEFIDEILNHVALQITQHERWRFWTKEIFEKKYSFDKKAYAANFLPRPPADTLVLLGYVKNSRHLKWIHSKKLYNLRADERKGSVGLRSAELATDLILLYGPDIEQIELWQVTGEPTILNQNRILELEYPNPTGTIYFCIPVKEISLGNSLMKITIEKVYEVRERAAPKAIKGAPVVSAWLELVT